MNGKMKFKFEGAKDNEIATDLKKKKEVWEYNILIQIHNYSKQFIYSF